MFSGVGSGRDTIAPQKFGQGRGLGFLLTPLARTDFLQELAEAELALAFGRTAQGRDADCVDAVAFVLEVAAITRLGALQATGVIIRRLDAVDTIRRSSTRHHETKQYAQKQNAPFSDLLPHFHTSLVYGALSLFDGFFGCTPIS